MKTCKVCATVKELTSFQKNGNYADGHLSTCKDCLKAKPKSDAHKAKQRAYCRAWRERNLEAERERCRLNEQARRQTGKPREATKARYNRLELA